MALVHLGITGLPGGRGPLLAEDAADHRIERGQRLARVIGIEGNLVVFRGELDGAFIVRAVPVVLPLVLVDADLVAVEIGLEDAVLFQHPVVGLADERLQDGGDDLAVVERTERLADVVQQTAHHVLFVLAVAERPGRRLQAVAEPVHGIGFVALEARQHVHQQIGQRAPGSARGRGPSPGSRPCCPRPCA